MATQVIINNKFLLLRDGVRISTAGGEIANISHNTPIYYAKQVEVLMGPASVSYGADAFLGVINIISMDENDRDLTELSISGGNDDYGNAHAYIKSHFDNGVHLNLGIDSFQSQQYQFASDFPEYYPSGETSPTGLPFEFPQDKSFSLFGKINTQSHWEFGFNYSHMTTSTYASSLPQASSFDPDNQEHISQATLYGKYQLELAPQLYSSTNLSYLRYEMENDTNYNNIFTGFQTAYKYAKTDRYSINQDFIYRGIDANILSFGIVYDNFNSIPIGADLPSPFDTSKSASEQNLNYPDTTLPILFIESKHENWGGYFQDNWKIDEQWRLVTGLRYDNDSQYGDSLNPRLSAIYKYNDKNLFKLLYGHSFLAPSPDTAFRHFGGFSDFNTETGLWESHFFRAPNPNLKPEKLRSLELNYEHQFNSDNHIKLVPFYTWVDDVIRMSADDTPQQFIPGAQIGFTESEKNSGQLHIYGLDIAINNHIQFDTVQLKNWLYLSYVDGKQKEGGVYSELPMTSKYKLKGGMSIIWHEDYTISPQLYWIGASTNNEIDPNDLNKHPMVPSYVVADLHLEAQLTPELKIICDTYNLLDNKYSNAMLQGPNIALPQAPQPGRLIAIGMSYQF